MGQNLTVYSRTDLEHAGASDHAIRQAVSAERLHRIRPGAYVDAADWTAAPIEQRQRAAAATALRASRGPLVLAGITAAAVHGLPLFRLRDERVHVLCHADRVAAKNPFVMRHEVPFTDDDLTLVDGMPVTSLDRTVCDVIRSIPLEAGVALADAALAMAPDGADELRARLVRRIACLPGARGIRRAREVAAFADPRSGSPLESASRWFLHVLGFRNVRIQEPFPGPNGADYLLDFRFRRGIGEVDGATKYRDPAFLAGRTPQQALIDEKRREDWIRGRTQEPFARWMDRDMPNARALGAHLASFGIRP
ncbi:hypothetical protein ACWDR7_06160 [Microbacterium sp. NPDC003461]